MRLFLGIYPSREHLAYYRDIKRQLDKEKRNLRFVDLERLHLTLKFIGSNVSQASKNDISRELQRHAGSYPKPQIAVESVSLGFASQLSPRIIMANIEQNYELDELTKVLHKYIRDLKRRDTIKWKQRDEASYHVSLARLKPAATKSTGRDVDKLVEQIDLPLPEPFVAEEMYLVTSEITPKGPIYRKLETIRL
jgi:2'-5' RNA ligase